MKPYLIRDVKLIIVLLYYNNIHLTVCIIINIFTYDVKNDIVYVYIQSMKCTIYYYKVL